MEGEKIGAPLLTNLHPNKGLGFFRSSAWIKFHSLMTSIVHIVSLWWNNFCDGIRKGFDVVIQFLGGLLIPHWVRFRSQTHLVNTWYCFGLCSSFSFGLLVLQYLNELIFPDSPKPNWVWILPGCLVGLAGFIFLWMLEPADNHTRLIRVAKPIINFVIAVWAAYHSESVHGDTPKLGVALRESGIALSFGVYLSTILGLYQGGDHLELVDLVGSCIQGYSVLLVTFKKLKAASCLAAAFLIPCVVLAVRDLKAFIQNRRQTSIPSPT